MRIFVYEFVTGGGWFNEPAESPPESLAAEGAAMLAALVADFGAIEGVRVDTTRDVRSPQSTLPSCTIHDVGSARDEEEAFRRLAAATDWSVIVAPEFDGHLLRRCELVELAGGRLLGPASRLVALASDKHRTAEHLAAHGVRTPHGIALAPGDRLPLDFAYPAVLKPRDGAGSLGVRLIARPREARDTAVVRPMRLETYCPGMPASVACLGGPRSIFPLNPCRQNLSDDGQFEYLGGCLPLDGLRAKRATDLALRASRAVGHTLGYLGVDMVLGADESGADDRVIEINPRMTTSYVGLRALARNNLAAAMLAIAEERQVTLSWRPGPVQFDAAGKVEHVSPSRGESVAGGL